MSLMHCCGPLKAQEVVVTGRRLAPPMRNKRETDPYRPPPTIRHWSSLKIATLHPTTTFLVVQRCMFDS